MKGNELLGTLGMAVLVTVGAAFFIWEFLAWIWHHPTIALIVMATAILGTAWGMTARPPYEGSHQAEKDETWR